jgi:hypothetical protein
MIIGFIGMGVNGVILGIGAFLKVLEGPKQNG